MGRLELVPSSIPIDRGTSLPARDKNCIKKPAGTKELPKFLLLLINIFVPLKSSRFKRLVNTI